MPARKPTNQKKLQGTSRKSRENPKEPQYRAELPPPPDWLSPRACELWAMYGAELNAQRVMARAFTGALAVYCLMEEEVAELSDLMNAGEKFLQDEEGGAKKYPLRKLRHEAIQRMEAAARELGLTPASAGKVSSIGEPPEADPLEKLLAKRQARQREAHPPN
jgi:P27 family predicted phage terminase small subunit